MGENAARASGCEHAPVPRRAPVVGRLLGARIETDGTGAVVVPNDFDPARRSRPVIDFALQFAAVEEIDRIADRRRAFRNEPPAFDLAVRPAAAVVSGRAREVAPSPSKDDVPPRRVAAGRTGRKAAEIHSPEVANQRAILRDGRTRPAEGVARQRLTPAGVDDAHLAGVVDDSLELGGHADHRRVEDRAAATCPALRTTPPPAMGTTRPCRTRCTSTCPNRRRRSGIWERRRVSVQSANPPLSMQRVSIAWAETPHAIVAMSAGTNLKKRSDIVGIAPPPVAYRGVTARRASTSRPSSSRPQGL